MEKSGDAAQDSYNTPVRKLIHRRGASFAAVGRGSLSIALGSSASERT